MSRRRGEYPIEIGPFLGLIRAHLKPERGQNERYVSDRHSRTYPPQGQLKLLDPTRNQHPSKTKFSKIGK